MLMAAVGARPLRTAPILRPEITSEEAGRIAEAAYAGDAPVAQMQMLSRGERQFRLDLRQWFALALAGPLLADYPFMSNIRR